MLFNKPTMPQPNEALLGRAEPMPIHNQHYVLKNSIAPPFPEHIKLAIFGLGCFWGAERKFWQLDSIYSTAVGYCAGFTPNPTYEEVCTGQTGHNEVVLVAYDEQKTSYDILLDIFWSSHNPTQGMRQANDTGTQYRSGIYYYDDQQYEIAECSKATFQAKLNASGHGAITTEIMSVQTFYYAEDYHQQYLAKNPNGYCGLGGLNL